MQKHKVHEDKVGAVYVVDPEKAFSDRGEALLKSIMSESHGLSLGEIQSVIVTALAEITWRCLNYDQVKYRKHMIFFAETCRNVANVDTSEK